MYFLTNSAISQGAVYLCPIYLVFTIKWHFLAVM